MERIKEFYKRLGYPEEWLETGSQYSEHDSYVIFDPAWHDPLPDIPEISIYELFRRTAERFPEEIAISFLDRDMSYRELNDRINRFASLLLDLGVKKGECIVPMMPTCTQHFIVFFAAARIGATSAPINAMYKTKEIAYQVKDCAAKTVITLDMFYPYFEQLKDELGIENIIVTNIRDFASPGFKAYAGLEPFWKYPKQAIKGTIDFVEVFSKYAPTDIEVECSPREDVPLIIYTSGTTGEPKGALETHYNLVHNTITHAAILQAEGNGVNFSILPMNHTGGYMLWTLPTLYRGGTVVLRPLFNVEDCLNAIQKHKVTFLFGPPTFYQGLMMHPKIEEYDLSSLSMCISGAAPVPPEVKKAWRDKTGLQMAVGYGATEMNTMGTFSGLKYKANTESVGLPYIGELKIEKDGKVAPRGEVGEVLFRGLQVSKGYLNKPDITAETFQKDGWLRTGDAGRMDEDGFLHYVDRIKDLIIASGYNIAPAEVEAIIFSNPAVAEVGVIGVPDEYRGETVKAFVVLTPEAKGKVTEQDIIDDFRKRAAVFKAPTQVQFLDELPKNVMGKTLRRYLRELNK